MRPAPDMPFSLWRLHVLERAPVMLKSVWPLRSSPVIKRTIVSLIQDLRMAKRFNT